MKKNLLFFIIFSSLVSSQIPKSADSLQTYLKTKPKDTLYVLALNEYSMLQIQNGDYKQADKIIAQMESLSGNLDFKTGFYKTANMKGVLEYTKQNPEKAMQYFLQSRDIIKKYKLEKKYYQNCLNNISIIYKDLGDRENATKYAFELIDFQEKNKLYPLKTFPYDQIGSNLKFYKKYNEALIYFNKSLDIETKRKNFLGMAISENNIANVYEDLEQVKTSIYHLKRGLQYAEKVNYKLLKTDLLTNLGRLSMKDRNLKDAEKYLLESEKICRELDVKGSLKIVCQCLGDLYEEKGDDISALRYYLEALQLVKDIHDSQFTYSINDNLAKFYFKKGDYKRAYLHQQESAAAKDSVFKIETQENTENLLRKYEADKKQQEIKTLTAENTIKNLKIKNSEKQKWYFISGISLLAIIGGMLFYQSRQRKKNNQKLQQLNKELDTANKNKMRFFGILNHDLRSPVASLVHFLHLQKDAPELLDEQTKNRLNQQTTNSAERLLQQMEDLLLWSKSQMEKFEAEKKQFPVKELFSELQNEFIWVENTEIVFEDFSEIKVFFDKEYLKTILRNLIGNAVKVLGNKPEAKIICSAENISDSVKISVKDNGGGTEIEKFKALYSESESIGIKQGLGFHVIRDLCKAIDTEIEVKTDKEIGETEIYLYLKKIESDSTSPATSRGMFEFFSGSERV